MSKPDTTEIPGLKTWLSRPWRTSPRGNYWTRRKDGTVVVIFSTAGGWQVVVSRSCVAFKRWSEQTFSTPDEGKRWAWAAIQQEQARRLERAQRMEVTP
jgi:hypothetical protein